MIIPEWSKTADGLNETQIHCLTAGGAYEAAAINSLPGACTTMVD